MQMINVFLNDPFNVEKLSKKVSFLASVYFYISFSLIAVTPILFFLDGTNQVLFISADYLTKINLFILFFFSVDLFLRLVSAPQKLSYVFSFNGAVDILAVLPTWISIIFGFGVNSSYLRILRMLRIGKLFNSLPPTSFLSGFRGRLIMITIAIVGIKLIIMTFEEGSHYPKFDNINIILGLVTFSLAMLLGTKLSVLNSRMYSIEDAICRCVGALKIFWEKDNQLHGELKDWAIGFNETIQNPSKSKVSSMRLKNNHLYKILVSKHDGPNLANFVRDIAYILHRATASSPIAYENVLRDITAVFTIVILFVIPGLTGLVSVLVLSYVFFGMFFLVDDIDRPLDFSNESLINANLEPLEEFIDNH